MIAHRLSTIKSEDYVAFLNNGRCEAFGSFDTVYKANESFRKVLGEGED